MITEQDLNYNLCASRAQASRSKHRVTGQGLIEGRWGALIQAGGGFQLLWKSLRIKQCTLQLHSRAANQFSDFFGRACLADQLTQKPDREARVLQIRHAAQWRVAELDSGETRRADSLSDELRAQRRSWCPFAAAQIIQIFPLFRGELNRQCHALIHRHSQNVTERLAFKP